MIVTCGIT